MERYYPQHNELQLYAPEADRIERLINIGYLQELAGYNQWVCYRVEQVSGRRTKVPINPRTNVYASSTDARTWGSCREALTKLRSGSVQGIGFVTTKNDPYIFLDIDDCVQGNRSISYQGQKAMELLETAWQYSPGNGLHGIGKGDIGGINRKAGNFEVYTHDRFMTLTFLPVPDSLANIEDIAEPLTALLGGSGKKDIPKRTHVPMQTTKPPVQADDLGDVYWDYLDEPRYQQLFEGNWQQYYESQSEADLAFCAMLLLKTGGDPGKTRELFLSSGLSREKTLRRWGKSTYLDETINRARQRLKQE